MNVHKNARLTPKGREAMVRDVVDLGLTQSEASRRHHTTPYTPQTNGKARALHPNRTSRVDLRHRI